TKTRVVNDREAGFDFLGFHHRRAWLAKRRHEAWGVLRWPSQRACRRFRERVRQLAGPPGSTRERWGEVQRRLRQYLAGWKQYFQRGQRYRVFVKLDRYVTERLARNLARSQPTGRKRRRRSRGEYAQALQ